MWFILLLVLAFVVYKIIKNNKNDAVGGMSERDIASIVEAADRNDPAAKKKLYEYFDRGLTDEAYNEIRRKVYLPKAQAGDANAQYYMGLLSKTKQDMISWWTKSAENGNTQAMSGLSLGYSLDVSDSLGFGIDKNKSEYWLRKAAETDPAAMVSLALDYSVNDRDYEALELYLKAGNMAHGKTKVKAYQSAAQIYGNPMFSGYDINEQRRCLVTALSVKPWPADDNYDFNEYYASASRWLSVWYESRYYGSKSLGDLKNAAYCAVVAAVLDRDYADELGKFSSVYSQTEYSKWILDARNYNFNLPC